MSDSDSYDLRFTAALGRRVFAAVALAVLAAGCGGDDGDGATLAAERVRLEPIGASVPDAFTGDFAVDPPGGALAIALPDVPPLGASVAATLSGRVADGDEPGLFGGTRDETTCDVDGLVAFLTDEDNADKAAAWAGVHGIDVDDIADFVGRLTPVRLRFDTRVTNHGFRDGAAVAVQSLLQAGTAVLVDDRGVPAVKCSCGNPLLAPTSSSGVDDDDALDIVAVAENPDDAWSDLDPAEAVTVRSAGDAIDDFLLVDVANGALFGRPAGTTGDSDDDGDRFPDKCELFAESPSCGGPGETGGERCALLDTNEVRLVGRFTGQAVDATGTELEVRDDVALEPNRIELRVGAGGDVRGEWAFLTVSSPLEGERDAAGRRITGRTVPNPLSFDDDLGRVVEVRGFEAELDEEVCAYVGRFEGGGILRVPGAPDLVARVPGPFELRASE